MTNIGLKAWGPAISLLLISCSTSAQPAKKPAPGDVVATVGSISITLAEVDDKALQQPAASFGDVKLVQALYEARSAAIEEIIGNIVLDQEAKARKIERAKLEETEIESKVEPVTDVEVAAWYKDNQARVRGAPLDQVRVPIKDFLTRSRVQALRQDYIDRLKGKTPFRILLEPPRAVVATTGRPAKGPANAPIELIEFSDFQCPFCLQANPTVTKVLDTYGDRIHFVYRHYPLPNHPNARPAAEAAECAAEQDKFWPYHDRLFASAGKLADSDLKQAAADLGLDSGRFSSCFEARKYTSIVDADIRAGNDAGVSATPAFFINGRLVSGAQPFDVFKGIIDEELERKKP
jgi:protein-disulfide isomerase